MKKVTKKISEKTGIPPEVISSTPKLEITGSNKIYIENHKGIKMLTGETIVIRLKDFSVTIEGKNISISEIDKEHIFLTGDFCAVKFDKNLE